MKAPFDAIHFQDCSQLVGLHAILDLSLVSFVFHFPNGFQVLQPDKSLLFVPRIQPNATNKQIEGKEDAVNDVRVSEDLYTKMKPKDVGPGPYFLGNSLSYAEIAMMPFFDRFSPTLKHYRDFD